MSETIEERYEKVPQWYSDVLENAKYALPMIDELDNLRSLLDDLMAERGKSVNLDEIFPKEVMEKAKCFYVKPCRENTGAILYTGLYTACAKGFGIYGDGEYVIQALDDAPPRGINLETRRCRLSLKIEKVED